MTSSKAYNSNFGREVSNSLASRNTTQSALATATGTTAAYVNQTITGVKRPSARWADLIADVLQLPDDERRKLHLAAAKDHGFKLD